MAAWSTYDKLDRTHGNNGVDLIPLLVGVGGDTHSGEDVIFILFVGGSNDEVVILVQANEWEKAVDLRICNYADSEIILRRM